MVFPTHKGVRCDHCHAAPLQDAVEVWEWDPDPLPVVYLGCHQCLRGKLLQQAWLSWRPWNLVRHPLIALWAFFKNLSLGLCLKWISPTRWLRNALARENISYREFMDGQSGPGLSQDQRIEIAKSLCVVLRSVGHADGTLDKKEWVSVHSGLRALYQPEPDVYAALELPDDPPKAPEQDEVDWAASVLRKRLRRVDHGLVCHLLLSVAERVGGVTEAERITLIWIGQRCGFSDDLLFKALRGIGSFGHQSATGAGGGSSSSRRRAAAAEPSAWEVLGLEPDSPQAEIRERYRELALENHPDRHAHLGEAMVRAATVRMKQINAAYKELRGSRRRSK
jgi:hypothetical protein